MGLALAKLGKVVEGGPVITLCSATWLQPDWPRCIASWGSPVLIIPKMDILPAYQKGLDLTTDPIIGYVHDDVICNEECWRKRVLHEFKDDPSVALVGFGGGTGHGESWMYERPFQIPSMVRVGFHSNLIDAERHGKRLTGSINGSVLDGFAFFVRRSFMDAIGGWPLNTPVSYFMYMEWLSCMARRRGKTIRIVGVACEHLGGRSSGKNPNLKLDYEGEHRYIYDNFRDVFPARVKA